MVTTFYQVKDRTGQLVAVHKRVDLPDGGKDIKWLRPDGRLGLNGTPVEALPLYLIERLGEWSGPIVVTEGEKCADALVAAGIPAVATVCGAATTPSEDVLADLSGHSVVLWPDADAVGRKHMQDIAAVLEELAAVGWVEPPADVPRGWDAADALAEGRDVRELLAGATVPPEAPRPGPVTVRVLDVEPERVSWLWDGRLPLGKVAIVEGDPGLGKSTITLDIAARVTRGLAMPDGVAGIDPAGVVILSAEDGIADTIRPRLTAAGADLSRAFVLVGVRDVKDEHFPSLPGDLDALEAVVRASGARLVLVDPLMAYLSGKVDSHRDHDVRRALAPLAAMGERTGATILVVRHLRKSSADQAIYRSSGSIGISGAARSILVVGRDADDDGRCVLAHLKSNLAPLMPSLGYRLEDSPEHGCARVEWLGAVDQDADQTLRPRPSDDEQDALAEAESFLREALAGGPLAATDVERQARDAGVSMSTLRRAKKSLGVVTARTGFGPGGRWTWTLRGAA